MADIKNKNELKRRTELFLDEFSYEEYKSNEQFCKDTMRMVREFVGRASHLLDQKETHIRKLQAALKREQEEKSKMTSITYGKWKYSPKENVAICSNCEYEHYLGTYRQYASSFCPNCGAKMEE